MEGCSVKGVIEEKFESGYIVSVRMGSEELKGVVYHGEEDKKRKKKKGKRKRDSGLPKPRRTAYNYFFAAQHGIIKADHKGKETDIGRKIGQLWKKVPESDKVPYQEMAKKDKERYISEMEDYVKKLKMELEVIHAVPLRQWPPPPPPSPSNACF